jgi:hypothetical protein
MQTSVRSLERLADVARGQFPALELIGIPVGAVSLIADTVTAFLTAFDQL